MVLLCEARVFGELFGRFCVPFGAINGGSDEFEDPFRRRRAFVGCVDDSDCGSSHCAEPVRS